MSDLSFFNRNNVQGTKYTPFDQVDKDSRGPFKAQTLPFDKSADLWGKVCNVNKLDAASAETMLRTAFATLLDAVRKMVGPNGDYVVPIWDQITPLFNGGYNFTRTMRDDEVRPPLLGPVGVAMLVLTRVAGVSRDCDAPDPDPRARDCDRERVWVRDHHQDPHVR